MKDKALVQEVIDRLLYCHEYRLMLIELNKQFPVDKNINYDMANFLFPQKTTK